MRISEWSSDLCSSDLSRGQELAHDAQVCARGDRQELRQSLHEPQDDGLENVHARLSVGPEAVGQNALPEFECVDGPALVEDRKSDVKGTRASARVDPGGRRLPHTKKHNNTTTD